MKKFSIYASSVMETKNLAQILNLLEWTRVKIETNNSQV